MARGRVELSLSLQLRQVPGVDVEFNDDFAPRARSRRLEQARARGLVTGALTPGDLLRMPQAITIRDRQADDDDQRSDAMAAPARAAPIDRRSSDLDTMRSREGDHLRADLDQRRDVRRRSGRAHRGSRPTKAALAMEAAARPSASRELRTELQADETAVAQEIVRGGVAVGHQRGSLAVPRRTSSHWVRSRRGRTVRPQARISCSRR